MRILKTMGIVLTLALASCDNTNNLKKVVEPTIPLPMPHIFAQQKNCFACHSLSGNMIGPSWTNIAQHYKNDPKNINTLTEKILNGGSGSFGQANMPPQKNNLTADEATYLAKWILNGARN